MEGGLLDSGDEETRERLSSLIRQKGLTGGGGGRDEDDCYWVLLAESSRDRFVILEGIHESCWHAARNDEFKLVAVGRAASKDGCAVFWPAAVDLACVVYKIMRMKRKSPNDSDIVQESAIRGLPICHLVGCEARFSPFPRRSSPPSLEFDMQMLSRVLKPPSVLAAATTSPSLLAQGPLHETASTSSAPLAFLVLTIAYAALVLYVTETYTHSWMEKLQMLPLCIVAVTPPMLWAIMFRKFHG